MFEKESCLFMLELLVGQLIVFDRALFDSLGRVANVSLEGDVTPSYQAKLPVSVYPYKCLLAHVEATLDLAVANSLFIITCGLLS